MVFPLDIKNRTSIRCSVRFLDLKGWSDSLPSFGPVAYAAKATGAWAPGNAMVLPFAVFTRYLTRPTGILDTLHATCNPSVETKSRPIFKEQKAQGFATYWVTRATSAASPLCLLGEGATSFPATSSIPQLSPGNSPKSPFSQSNKFGRISSWLHHFTLYRPKG